MNKHQIGKAIDVLALLFCVIAAAAIIGSVRPDPDAYPGCTWDGCG